MDDASTDDSVLQLETFGNQVQLLRGDWGNGNCARNQGLRSAKGDWIQFLDADDELKPDKIADQLAMVQKDVDAVYGGVTLQWWVNSQLQESVDSSPSQDLDQASHWLNWQLAQTGAVLWRAAALREIGGWNESFSCCQDNEVCLRSLKRGLRFVQSKESGAVYRIWSEESVCRRDPMELTSVKTGLIDEMLAWLEAKGTLKPQHQIIAGRACFALARKLAVRDRDTASEYARERIAAHLFDAGDAPAAFGLIHRLFGYCAAENLATLQRRLRNRGAIAL